MKKGKTEGIIEALPDELKKPSPAEETTVFRKRTGTPPPGSIIELLTSVGFGELPEDPGGDDLDAVLKTLRKSANGVDRVRREAIRLDAVRWLTKLKVKAPGKMIDAALERGEPSSPGAGDGSQGNSIFNSEPEAWGEPVDAVKLLNDLRDTFTRYLILPTDAPVALALWVVHTYAVSITNVCPILSISSAIGGCAKTRTLEILGLLVNKPVTAASITTSTLFRSIDSFQPTLLIDEADTAFVGNEELRGVVNSGHNRGTAYVLRSVGDEHEPRKFSTFGPKVIALIGKLPPTIEDRSISIRMNKKKPTEAVGIFNPQHARTELEPLRRKAVRWVNDNLDELRTKTGYPDTLPALSDRANDNWSPLLAIATVAGGDDWPIWANNAAVSLSPREGEIDTSAAPQLLADLRALFDEYKAVKLASIYIVGRLKEMEERPWPEWKNSKPITQTQLAKVLKPFGIKPEMMRIDGYAKGLRGYKQEQFKDAWERYIPARKPHTPPSQPATPQQSNADKPLSDDTTRNKEGECCTPESPANPPGQDIVAGLHPEKGV